MNTIGENKSRLNQPYHYRSPRMVKELLIDRQIAIRQSLIDVIMAGTETAPSSHPPNSSWPGEAIDTPITNQFLPPPPDHPTCKKQHVHQPYFEVCLASKLLNRLFYVRFHQFPLGLHRSSVVMHSEYLKYESLGSLDLPEW
jgi:hypothetical protein